MLFLEHEAQIDRNNYGTMLFMSIVIVHLFIFYFFVSFLLIMTFDLKAQPASISFAICGLRRIIIVVFSFFKLIKWKWKWKPISISIHRRFECLSFLRLSSDRVTFFSLILSAIFQLKEDFPKHYRRYIIHGIFLGAFPNNPRLEFWIRKNLKIDYAFLY